jgi:hypothetical protein
MIKILKKPAALNYTKSLPHIEFTSDVAEVMVNILDDGVELISERYNPFNATTPLVLKYAGLLHGNQNMSIPGADRVTVQDQGVRNYTVQISDSESSEELAFVAIKGFYYRQPLDLEFYTAYNWLNIGILPQSVKTHQPVYLTAYPAEPITVKVDCIYEDGTTGTFEYARLVAGKLQTLDVSPYLVQQLSFDKLAQYTIYGNSSAGILTLRKQVFSVEHFNPLIHDFFVFENRLGGFDSLVMFGELKDTFKNNPSNALFDDHVVEYATNPTRTVLKNTGYIQSLQHRQLLIDFSFSINRYHVLDGALRRINLKESSLDFTNNNLNEFDIEFSYSDSLLAYPQIEQAPNYLKI